MLKLCFLNAQSLRNKSTHFVCYASSIGADIFAATETWFSEFDGAHRAEATPPGFNLIAIKKVRSCVRDSYEQISLFICITFSF